MAHFSKYNNPRRKKQYRKHDQRYVDDLRTQMYAALANCNSEKERDNVLTSYGITLNS